MKKEKKVSFTLFIDGEVKEKIKEIGKAQRRSKGAVIRILIDEALEAREKKGH